MKPPFGLNAVFSFQMTEIHQFTRTQASHMLVNTFMAELNARRL